MDKKWLTILLSIIGVAAIIGGGGYFYKQFLFKETWTPIKVSTPQETFDTYLKAAYSGDWKAINRVSANNAELKESGLFGAFDKCIEIKIISEYDDSDPEDGRADLFEDNIYQNPVAPFADTINATKRLPQRIKVTDSLIFQDEAVLTFFFTDKRGNMTGSVERKALFKKLGNEWKIFYSLSEKSQFEKLNFAIQKPLCKYEPPPKNGGWD